MEAWGVGHGAWSRERGAKNVETRLIASLPYAPCSMPLVDLQFLHVCALSGLNL